MRQHGSKPRPKQRMTCSTCGREFLLDQTPAPPFCSDRCKSIDLGRWLDEEIGVPHEGGPDDGQTPQLDPEDLD